MNTVRLLRGIGTALLAAVVLAAPAAAQEKADADTIWVDGDDTIVITNKDGRRIIVRSADDAEGPRVFFRDEKGPRVFGVQPGEFSPRVIAPKVWGFQGDWLDDTEGEVALLDNMLGDLSGGVWVDRLGDDPRVELGASMKERSEIAKMEMESRRLAQRARRAEGEEKARLEGELQDKLQEIFDRKQALREERVERLREAMNKALDQHNERNQHREEIIERRLRQLLGQRDAYDW